MRLLGDGGDEIARQVGVDLDRRRARAPRFGHGDLQVRLRRDRLHPRDLTGDGADGGGVGARVLEELRPGHQGGVVDVWPRDLAHPRGAGEVGHLAEVVGHVARR
jgi:hypothetical protein